MNSGLSPVPSIPWYLSMAGHIALPRMKMIPKGKPRSEVSSLNRNKAITKQLLPLLTSYLF